MGTVNSDSNADGTGKREVSLDELSLQQFKGALHTTFRVHCEDGRDVELLLVEVESVRSPSGGEGDESFSILFAGSGDSLLPQQIYRVANDSMGQFDLFIVPVAQEPDGYRYQAIFNRQSAEA